MGGKKKDDDQIFRNSLVYTLEVKLVSGPFERKPRQIPTRVIEALGSNTMEDVHDAIFDAFDREDDHCYDFQIGGRGPMDENALHVACEGCGDMDEVEGNTAQTVTLAELPLSIGSVMYYWFDFGDDWWHTIKVKSVEEQKTRGRKAASSYPRLVKSRWPSPPQYPDWEEYEEDEEDEENGK